MCKGDMKTPGYPGNLKHAALNDTKAIILKAETSSVQVQNLHHHVSLMSTSVIFLHLETYISYSEDSKLNEPSENP